MRTFSEIRVILFFSIILVFTCCTKEDSEPEYFNIEGISLDVTNIEMTTGETMNLFATLLPVGVVVDKEVEKNIQAVTLWKSDNKNVATVDENGVVTAVGPGNCKIFYIIGTLAATCDVTVRYFNENDLYSNWENASVRLLFNPAHMCTYNGSTYCWTFDGMRLNLSNESDTVALIVTELTYNTLSYYNGNDIEKNSISLNYSPIKLQLHQLLENSQSVINKNGDTISVVNMGDSNRLWCASNLGAQSPIETGGKYAWGELQEKETYCDANYIFYNDTINEYAKYCQQDSINTLLTEDDVVSCCYGQGWRIPTDSDFKSLIENSISYLCYVDSIGGMLLKCKKDGCVGNCLFFPFSGYSDYNIEETDFNNIYCCYWTSSLSGDTENESKALLASYVNHGMERLLPKITTVKRFYGASIRPLFTNQ